MVGRRTVLHYVGALRKDYTEKIMRFFPIVNTWIYKALLQKIQTVFLASAEYYRYFFLSLIRFYCDIVLQRTKLTLHKGLMVLV
jgi:hypothetical protein